MLSEVPDAGIRILIGSDTDNFVETAMRRRAFWQAYNCQYFNNYFPGISHAAEK
jgi:hypothetical protein